MPSITLKIAIASKSDLYLDMHNACEKEGIFSKEWEHQRLALILNVHKPAGKPCRTGHYVY